MSRRGAGLHGRLSARALLVLLTLTFELLLLAVNSWFSYATAADIVRERTDEIELGALRQIDGSLAQAFDEIERLLGKLRTSGRAAATVGEYVASQSIYDKLQAEERLLGYFSSIQDVYGSIQSINAYIPGKAFALYDEKLHLTYDDIERSDILRLIAGSENQVLMEEPGQAGPVPGFAPKGFAFWTALPGDAGDKVYVLVTMKRDWLGGLIGGEDNAVVMNAATGHIVWRGGGLEPDDVAGLDAAAMADGKPFRLTGRARSYQVRALEGSVGGWRILRLQDTATFAGEMNEILLHSLVTSAASMLLCVVAAAFFARSVTRPIGRLMEAAKAFRVGEAYRPLNVRPNRMGLRSLFMLYFTLIAAVPLLVGVLSLSISLSGIIERKIVSSLTGGIGQSSGNVDYFIDINERISKSVVTDRSLREYLVEVIENGGEEADNGQREAMRKVIAESMYLGKGVFETTLYGRDGNVLYSTSAFNDAPMDGAWLERMSDSKAAPVWVNRDRDAFGRNVLRLYREVKDDGSLRDGLYRFKTIGFVCITYYETDLEQLYGGIDVGGGAVYVTDGDGIVLSHKNKARLGEPSGIAAASLPASGAGSLTANAAGGGTLVVMNRCSNLPWVLVGEIPYAGVMADNWRIIYSNIAVFAASLFVILVLSNFVTRRITRPVGRLLSGLTAFSSGDRQAAFAQPGAPHEIEELGHAFDKMARQINELIEQVYEAKLRESELMNERRQSELIALRAQINPHFLYNTLESIIWLVRMGNAKKAADMIATLGDFFRLGVKKGSEFVRVEEEMAFERIYVSIYEARLEDKLKVVWDVDEALKDCLVPRTILQPILENAIYHGIQENENGGTVVVRCFEWGGCLAFTVRDDGPGIEQMKLADINLRLNRDLSGDSIGIYNVQKRLRLYYGGSWGISIESREGEGTTVTMLLPVSRAGEGQVQASK